MSWEDTIPISDLSLSTQGPFDSSIEDDNEDFIPTSQPKSLESSTGLDSLNKKKADELLSLEESSTIDETVAFSLKMIEETPAGNNSPDFIPSSEIRLKRKLNYETDKSEPFPKKPLEAISDKDNYLKYSGDIFSTQNEQHVEEPSSLQIPESPSVLGSQAISFVNETPTVMYPLNDTEIIDNLTIDLDASKVFANESVNVASGGDSVSEVLNDASRRTEMLRQSKSDSRFEDSRSSSVVEVEVRVTSSADESLNFSSDADKSKKADESVLRDAENSEVAIVHDDEKITNDSSKVNSTKESNAQEPALNETVDVNDLVLSEDPNQENKSVTELSRMDTVPVTTASSSETDKKKDLEKSKRLSKLRDEAAGEVQKHSTPENPMSKPLKIDESDSSIEHVTPYNDRYSISELTVDIKLMVKCKIEFDQDTKKPIKKTILEVVELDQTRKKRDPLFLEPVSTSTDKSKRHSSSSAGSVYSDKAGFPYPLPRKSISSTHTESSESADELFKQFRPVLENEFKLGVVVDECIGRHMSKFIRDKDRNYTPDSARVSSTPRNVKSRRKGTPMIRSTGSSENRTSDSSDNRRVEGRLEGINSLNSTKELARIEEDASDVQPLEGSTKENDLGEEKEEPVEEEDPLKEAEPHEEEEDEDEGEDELEEKEELQQKEKLGESKEKDPLADADDVEAQEDEGNDNDGDDVFFCTGTPIFARWNDHQYYPGELMNPSKYERWDVKFDDGTTKSAVRQDFILPAKWVKEGELVFALNGDKYEPGKIIGSKRKGGKTAYTVELDESNAQIIVQRSDLKLTEFFANIISEKYKPATVSTPGPKSTSYIDFDNVISGKRIREPRTPLRMATTPQAGTSSKKKRVPKSKASEEREEAADESSNRSVVNSSKKKSEIRIKTPSTAKGKKGKAKEGLSEGGDDDLDTPKKEEEVINTPLRSKTKSSAKGKSLRYDSAKTKTNETPTTSKKTGKIETPLAGTSVRGLRRQKASIESDSSETNHALEKNATPVRSARNKKKSEDKRPEVDVEEGPVSVRGKRKAKVSEESGNKTSLRESNESDKARSNSKGKKGKN